MKKKLSLFGLVAVSALMLGCESTQCRDNADCASACSDKAACCGSEACAEACSAEKECCGTCGGEAKGECCGTCGGEAHGHSHE